MIYKNIIAIAIGGALGTIGRGLLNMHSLWIGLPIATVIENIVGSFLLGLFTGWLIHKRTKDWVKTGIGVGFCGGFTTMSTLAADTLLLYMDSSLLHSFVYLFVSLFAGITLGFIGLILGSKWGESEVKRKVVNH
ncbi:MULTISPECIES: fluoride efflux transporter FluC [Sutcliffiella]|uniref:Fluoride-specific ion channel FluC n=1 Tax=Sutcliffiella cohnii TaxID=33932 RepID=A0A223KLK3_9BACI|nr:MULTISPECIES: CrcB family protein [Sutcliffiella]AST90365.1 hypothetical protein BC6307_03310 [Sutcliffiella cohnii]WBL16020.1 CrcB family protein [Sutcliffiella sp. NC1]